MWAHVPQSLEDAGFSEENVRMISDALLNAPDDAARVKAGRPFVKKIGAPHVCRFKSGAHSTENREMGNICYRGGKIDMSLYYYNLAILDAPEGSRELALAYSNRSASNYMNKRYNESILDIKRAFKIGGCGKAVNKKLLQRRSACESALLDQLSISDQEEYRRRIFALPAETNLLVPCASAKAKISHLSINGRFIIATNEILPGEVISAERPFVSCPSGAHFLYMCHECSKLNFAMIPCKGCAFIMYCDESCQEKSWDKFHRYECPIMHTFGYDRKSCAILLVLRALIRARNEYKSWEEFQNAIENLNANDHPLHKGMAVGFDSQLFATVFTMYVDKSDNDPNVIFQKITSTVILINLLKKHVDYFSDCAPDKDGGSKVNTLNEQKCMHAVGGVLYRLISVIESNPFAFPKNSEYDFHNNYDDKFLGIFPFSNLYNHSCFPNAHWIKDNLNVVVLAQRVIKRGEQIFISYGPTYFNHSYPLRKKKLDIYNFVCRCEACEGSWPLQNPVIEAYSVATFPAIFEDILESGDKKKGLEALEILYSEVIKMEREGRLIMLVEYRRMIIKYWLMMADDDIE